MTVQTTQQQIEDREITLRDLILGFRAYSREAMSKWWLYALVFLPVAGYMGWRAYATPATYTARVTFMVNEDEGTGLGSAGLILGQLGMGMRRGRFNLDKMLALARSRRIVQDVLFARWQIDGRDDYLANHIMSVYELDKQWAEDDPIFEDFRYMGDSIPAFADHERKALVSLYHFLMGADKKKGLITTSYDDLSTMLTIACESVHEELSIALSKTMFDMLSTFYITQSNEKQLQTYEVVQTKVDSIEGELASAEYALAVFRDAATSMWSSVDRLREPRLQREITKLSAMLVEAVKNRELAEFSWRNATPLIGAVDEPMSPLKPVKPSVIRALLLAGIIVFIGVSALLFARRAVREAMTEG